MYLKAYCQAIVSCIFQYYVIVVTSMSYKESQSFGKGSLQQFSVLKWSNLYYLHVGSERAQVWKCNAITPVI